MNARRGALRRRLDLVEFGLKAGASYVPPIIVWQFIDPETNGIVGTYCPNTGEAAGIAVGTSLDGLVQVRS